MSATADGRREQRGSRLALLVLSLVLCAPRASLPAPPAARPSLPAQSDEQTAPRILDDFADLTPWTAVASDGAEASIHPAEGVLGARALRLDFDLAGTAGFALARRFLPLELPSRYEISFSVRADGEYASDLQVKLVDATGENVWWFKRSDFPFSRAWQLLRIKSRQIEFAWGPTRDRTLRHAATLELAVAAGHGRGHGTVYVSQLQLRALPEEPAVPPPPFVAASSSLPGAEARFILDGRTTTAWKSDPAAGPAQSLTIDFRRRREFGGLIIRWLGHAYASRYEIERSDDGVHWHTVARIAQGTGGPDAFLLPDAETRFLRLALRDGPASAYALAELEVKDLAFGASPNAFFQALARESPRGVYPRGFSGEQVYWTVVGIDGGSESGLLSEDGALEVAKGGFTIEPFVVGNDSRTVTWADVTTGHFLDGGELPIPGVIWRQPEWELRVTSFASGTRESSHLVARYTLENLAGRRQELRLVLAVRPFQVNPPTQTLNTVGGVSPIRDFDWDGRTLSINGERKVFPLTAPDRVGVFPLEAGPIPVLFKAGDWGRVHRVHDDAGYASAALGYRLVLAPHAVATVGLVVPLSGRARRPDLHGHPTAWMDREMATTAAAWRERLARVTIRVPPPARPLIATLHTAQAQILVNRDGPALRPGTRSYARSWIRDGAMMAEALLRLGHSDAAADYLRWYAPYQFADGKVPCCVDGRGADPVAEHDSAGELIFLAAEVYRYTGDRALLENMWPRIAAAASYLDTLRRTERSSVNLGATTRALYGLLPASISHEGYSAKPMHSYWDDFWALKGYTLAVAMARELGHQDAADRLQASREEFRRDLAASLRQTTAAHGISYLPGSAELGDFDPTSSAIALAPVGDMDVLPADLIRPTYERYWQEFTAHRDGGAAWDAYTPYEIRTVGTFVRLGWRDRAHELLRFFLAGRRPAAWNQWAEVVGRDPRSPRFVGDMPHGWVASDFIRAVLDLFAYERDGDRTLVLGAGILPQWLDGSGVVITGLHTPYGPLSYALRSRGAGVELQVAAGLRLPPGGLTFVWPGRAAPPLDTLINGKPASWRGTELRIHALPATVVARDDR